MVNNKLNTKCFFIIALGAISSTFSGYSFSDDCEPKIETLNKGVLKVTSSTVTPFAYRNGDGNFSGIDAEIIHKFAEENCLKVEHVLTSASAAIQNVVSSRADMSAGAWYRTAARAEVLGVTNPLYLEQTAIYSKDGFSGFDELQSMRVGTVQGYLWVPELRDLYGSDLTLYPDPNAMIQDMASGRIDAAVNTYAIGVQAKKEGGLPEEIEVRIAEPDDAVKSSVYPAQTGFLYRKGNEELGVALNNFISKLHDNGVVADILESYDLDRTAADVGEPRFADQ